MNTSALKSFAPAVRRQLMEAVERKLDVVLAAQSPDYLATYARQVAALRALAQADRAGLVERVAYTWFNRLAALRYLDAQGWHPFRTRVLTAASDDETQPELLRVVRTSGVPEDLQRYTSPARLNDLLDGRIPSSDPQGEVYRHLVLAACRFYHFLLPDLFERLDDETELLLPDDLLTEQSVVHGFRTRITDADCAEVEVLGWLYQFYISEKKDAVMARKSAVPTEDIPAVTQLFTPHWIVRYLVENSLGRLWLLNRPASRLRDQMLYYIEGEPETDFLRITTPEEIRVLDPAVGSGHMLTYAFDLLYAIYEEEGYAPSEIAGLILKHNLYGVDIDPRAAQLASLALVLKARDRSRRFFQPGVLARPHVIALQDVRFEPGELRDYVRALGFGQLFNQTVMDLMGQFEEATTFGSLIQPVLKEQDIQQLLEAIEEKKLGTDLLLSVTQEKLLRVLQQAEYLTQRYHVAVANPPYLGPKQMSVALREFSKLKFVDSKADLYAMFMERAFLLTRERGYVAFVAMQSWMFLHSFEALRLKLIRTKTILTMAHLGPRAFSTISGEIVTVAAWCCVNARISGYPGVYFRLVEGNHSEKEQALLAGTNRYPGVIQDSFHAIPGSPVAYWIGDSLLQAFSNLAVADMTISDGQNKTADNAQYVREHWEVSARNIGREQKWLPYAKGGPHRRWSGNLESVVNWSKEARTHYRTSAACRIIPEYLWYRPGVTWSRVGSGLRGFRRLPPNTTFDMVGSSIFLKENADADFLLGLLNTPVTQRVLELLNPSIDLQVKDVRNVPVPVNVERVQVEEIVRELVSLSESDWDASETSLNYQRSPLLWDSNKQETLVASWLGWKEHRESARRRMQELEIENNRLFVQAFSLHREISPDVPDDEITLSRPDSHRDMVAFLSYSVGCMMGRYSLNAPGLILADAGDTLASYVVKVGKPLEELSFIPDEDGIVPVLDGEWFEDDVVAHTRDFLRATFGEATLRENLRFIEESLGKDLRKYFLTDFYKDHLQTYKKRPIYWMVQSPKKGFSVLVYLHRYTRDTMNRVLNRYLRDYQVKLRNRLEHLALVQASGTASARDKTAARKEADKLTRILTECQEWERQTVLPLAQARIELDLDDGVKVNYLKLGEALAPIPGLAAKDDE